jgi:hypothetical protein
MVRTLSSLLRRCPRSGRIVGIRHPTGWRAWLFIVSGPLALIWILLRVIPKPSRVGYPCVRAACSTAAVYAAWLLGFWGVMAAAGRTVRRWLAGSYVLLTLFVLAGSGAVVLVGLRAQPQDKLAPAGFSASEGGNRPMGTARGIFPGRVVWVRDPGATPWDGTNGTWWADGTGTVQSAVNRMMSDGVRHLAGAASDAPAWDAIFRHFNRSHGRGDLGYQAGETIAIKVNFNNVINYADADNQADGSPQSIVGLLDQLVNAAGVPEDRITVYEAPKTAPSRVIPDRVYNRGHAAFPGVVWADCTGGSGRTAISWSTTSITYSVANFFGRDLPTCVTGATYLINMSLLKGHNTAGVTLTAKNHFGSINAREHSLIACASRPMGSYSPFVDLIGHPHLGGKTLLFIIDGLYGVPDLDDSVRSSGRWNRLFGGQWSASYFMSLDPVAIDSVGLDFLSAEFGAALGEGKTANADNYLHEAACADRPPSGTVYRQGGTNLVSLGVHEHWNGPATKQYSRNLGTGSGIELVRVSPGRVCAPEARPAAGLLPDPGWVELACATPAAEIRYTVDGTEPTETSPRYEGALWVDTGLTVKAAAFASGLTDSEVTTASYTVCSEFPPLIRINFQPDGAPPEGWLADRGDVFGDRTNGLRYGWNVDHRDVSRRRNVNADPLLDTLAEFHSNGVWEIELPAGEYCVRASFGDPSNSRTNALNVERMSVWTGAVLAANAFASATRSVIVTDNRLSLDPGAAADTSTCINWVEINAHRVRCRVGGEVADGGFRLMLQTATNWTPTNVIVAVEASDDLAAWVTVATGAVQDGAARFDDPGVFTTRFYRTRQLWP